MFDALVSSKKYQLLVRFESEKKNGPRPLDFFVFTRFLQH